MDQGIFRVVDAGNIVFLPIANGALEWIAMGSPGEFLKRRASKPKAPTVCHALEMPQGQISPVEKSMGEADRTDRHFLTYENRIGRCGKTNSIDGRRGD